MPINSRQKGARAERQLANILKGKGFDTKRGVQYCGLQGNADVVGVSGIHIECKDVERLNIWNAYEQSTRDAREGEIPIVCHTKNRKPWLVTLSLDDFFDIWSKANG